LARYGKDLVQCRRRSQRPRHPLDGYRAIAFKSGGVLHLRSRNNKDFSRSYPVVFQALAKLPNETVIDGEIVAVDAEGRPSFQLLQNAAVGAVPIVYFVFDVMILAGRSVMAEPLEARRDLLERKVLPTLGEPERCVDGLDADLPVLIQSVASVTAILAFWRRAAAQQWRAPCAVSGRTNEMIKYSWRNRGAQYKRIEARWTRPAEGRTE
jgi:ATP-dependent DNA ligase